MGSIVYVNVFSSLLTSTRFQILFPPLCNLELEGDPFVCWYDGIPITVLQMGISVNIKARTIDELIEARKQIQIQMLENFIEVYVSACVRHWIREHVSEYCVFSMHLLCYS